MAELTHHLSYPLDAAAQQRFLEVADILDHIQGLQRYLLAACLTMRSYSSGKPIFEENQAGSCLYIVLKGEVLIYKSPTESEKDAVKEGKRTHLTILGPGKVFGEMACLDKLRPLRSASAQAIKPTTLFMLDGQTFDHLRAIFPSLIFDLLIYDLSARVRENNAHVEVLMSMQRAQRVARFLLDMAAQRGEPDGPGVRFDLGMSQVIAAKLLNMTHSALSKQLSALVDKKIIRRGPAKPLGEDVVPEKGGNQSRIITIVKMDLLRAQAKVSSK